MGDLSNMMIAGGILLSGVGAVFVGLARLRMADAWKIWAGRCDPKNPNFRPPLFSRKQ